MLPSRLQLEFSALSLEELVRIFYLTGCYTSSNLSDDLNQAGYQKEECDKIIRLVRCCAQNIINFDNFIKLNAKSLLTHLNQLPLNEHSLKWLDRCLIHVAESNLNDLEQRYNYPAKLDFSKFRTFHFTCSDQYAHFCDADRLAYLSELRQPTEETNATLTNTLDQSAEISPAHIEIDAEEKVVEEGVQNRQKAPNGFYRGLVSLGFMMSLVAVKNNPESIVKAAESVYKLFKR